MQTLENVATAAKSTFTLPLKRRITPDPIHVQFTEFHATHPEVYNLLVRLARDVKRRGFNRYSMKAIFERARCG